MDLPRANSLLLEASGVRKENMEILKLCTSCRRDLFYSYRKGDRTAGKTIELYRLEENPVRDGFGESKRKRWVPSLSRRSNFVQTFPNAFQKFA